MTASDIWTLAKRTFSEWSEDKCPRLAAAMALFTMLSLAPMLVITIKVVALALDDNAARFTLRDEALALTAQEHRILAYLMHRRDAVVSRSELGEHVYEQGYDPDSNVLDVLIGRIRRKIGAERLVTERGKGFRLVELP